LWHDCLLTIFIGGGVLDTHQIVEIYQLEAFCHHAVASAQ